MLNSILYAYLVFIGVCLAYSFFYIITTKDKKKFLVFVNLKHFKVIALAGVLSNFYFVYIALILPIFIYFIAAYTLEYLYKLATQNNEPIGKLDLSNVKANTVKDIIKIQFFYLPKSNAYLFIYFIFKAKITSFRAISDNITSIVLLGKPIWFFKACFHISEKIIELSSSEMLKRKKVLCRPQIFLQNLIKIIKTFYFLKMLSYHKITRPLTLTIRKINGIDKFIAAMESAKNIVTFNKFKTTVLSDIPHLFLTNDEKSGGQVFTSSYWIWVDGKKIETAKITKNQRIVFTLLKEDDIMEEPYVNTLKNTKKLDIDTPEKFIGLLYRANLLYWSDISEKLLWQSSDKSLSKIIGLADMPLTEKEIDLDKKAFLKEELNPKLYLRYRFSSKVVYNTKVYDDLMICDKAKQEILAIANDDMYNKIQTLEIDGSSVIDAHLKNEYVGIKSLIDSIK